MTTEYRFSKAGRFMELLGPGKGQRNTLGIRIIVGARQKGVEIELTEDEALQAAHDLIEGVQFFRRKAREEVKDGV